MHKTFLEELVFWTVKFEFPQRIVTLLLSLLPDMQYKVSCYQKLNAVKLCIAYSWLSWWLQNNTSSCYQTLLWGIILYPYKYSINMKYNLTYRSVLPVPSSSTTVVYLVYWLTLWTDRQWPTGWYISVYSCSVQKTWPVRWWKTITFSILSLCLLITWWNNFLQRAHYKVCNTAYFSNLCKVLDFNNLRKQFNNSSQIF